MVQPYHASQHITDAADLHDIAQRAAATCNQHDDTRILDTVVHDVDDFLLSHLGAQTVYSHGGSDCQGHDGSSQQIYQVIYNAALDGGKAQRCLTENQD